MPIAIGSFFGMLFSGTQSGDEAARIHILVVDQDNSAVSKGIQAGIDRDKNLAATVVPLALARDSVRRGNVAVAVVIPQGFGEAAGRAFFRGTDRPQLTMLYDPSHSMEVAMVRGVMTQHVMESVSREMFYGDSGRQIVDETLSRLDSSSIADDEKQSLRELLTAVLRFNRASRGDTAQAPGSTERRGLSLPFETHEEPLTTGTNSRYNGFAHSFAGMGLQFMLFAAINMGIEILVERQRGLWKRLRSAPVSKLTLLGAKIASGTVIGSLVLLVSFAFAIFVWGVRIEGSVAGFLGVAVASALMAACYGLLIAALGNTPNAARGVSVFATLLMVMLGGAWVPTFIFPAWLQKITVIMPTRWAVDGFDATTWRGLGFSAAVMPIVVLIGFSLAFAAIAISRFRWEEA